MTECFSENVSNYLKSYVYRLIDPRNGETFYVGKGKGNRVFVHAAGDFAELESDDHDLKRRRINAIKNAGFTVAHIIHRHGLDDATAREVESALIDAYPGLVNIQGGYESARRGAMHSQQIIQLYEAPDAIFRHRVILINVNRSPDEEGRTLYDAVRYAWKISPQKAKRFELVLAVQQGLIKDAFIVDDWLQSTPQNFPGFPEVDDRFGFRGKIAPEEIRQLYRNKRIPDAYRKAGAANPIRYIERCEPASSCD